jgi:hypothetical protein
MKFGEMLIKEIEEAEWTIKLHGKWVIEEGEVEWSGCERKWHCGRSHVVQLLIVLSQQSSVHGKELLCLLECKKIVFP